MTKLEVELTVRLYVRFSSQPRFLPISTTGTDVIAMKLLDSVVSLGSRRTRGDPSSERFGQQGERGLEGKAV